MAFDDDALRVAGMPAKGDADGARATEDLAGEGFGAGDVKVAAGEVAGVADGASNGAAVEPVGDGAGVGDMKAAGNQAERRKVSRPLVRRLVVLAVFLTCCASIVFGFGVGTVSSFGWDAVVAICPLGSVESMLAGKSVFLRALVCLAVAALACVVLGKFFCSWVCPIPSIRNVIDAVRRRTPSIESATWRRSDGKEETALAAVRPLSKREKRLLARSSSGCAGADAACTASSPTGEAAGGSSGAGVSVCSACGQGLAARSREKIDSRHVVLGGAVLSAAVFGFPVFCLVCPIGLTFATIVAIAQLFQIQALSWGLLVFPLVLTLELTVLRKWCSRFCPLGALMSLLSLPNRFFRPRVDMSKCLRGKGVDCRICSTVCAEGLDPHRSACLHECSKCRDCAQNCPVHAISFPLLGK